MAAQSPIEAIQTLGRYTLLEKIGEGYLGSVYRGFDQNLGQAVAVRVLCDGIKWDAKIEEIYNSQCQSVAGLKHEGIVSVLEFGKEGPFYYIVMESLGNSTLKSLIAEKPAMTVEAKLSIMIQVAEILSHAHKNGILHRDLGPAKIHLTADGKPKIRDFAIASVLMKHLPHPWIRFGQPIYLSPEQLQQMACDQRSDIFSAGTIFYELLTYHHPFHDRDSNKALDNILQEVQIPTFDLFPDVPPGIWPIMKTCLAKEPDNRYQSMDELAGACRDFLKDLAEDTRLMLSELYAAHNPLRIAAGRPDAPESAVALLQDIQKLLRGEKEADYISLDRLMTLLIEQYPAVQSVSASLPSTEPGPRELPLEETDGTAAEKPEIDAAAASAATQTPSPIEVALSKVLASDSPELAAPAKESTPEPGSETAGEDKKDPDALFSEMWNLSSDMQFALETSFVKPEEENLFASEFDPAPIPPAAVTSEPAIAPLSMEAAGGALPAPDTQHEPEEKAEQSEILCSEVSVSPAQPQPLPESSILRREEEMAPGNVSQEVLVSPAMPQPLVENPPPKRTVEKAPGDMPIQDMAAAGKQIIPDPGGAMQKPAENGAGSVTRYRRIPRPSYRTTVALLSLLLIAASAYIVWGTDFAKSITDVVKSRILNSSFAVNAYERFRGMKPSDTAETPSKNLQPAPSRRMEPVVTEPIPASSAEQKEIIDQPPQQLISRISGLINAGKMQPARSEIDKLQKAYPSAPQGSQLRRQWDAKNAAMAQEGIRKDEEQQKAMRKQKEEEWSRRLSAFLARGQYSEADNAVSLWLAEDPGSEKARENATKVAEIQRHLGVYSSALAEGKYPEALAALNSAEKLNPADTSFANLRRQLESRRAVAKSSLTVYRLGSKAILSLDGRPLGSDGEVVNESIPIGYHTLAVENGGSVISSRRLEFFENQRIVMVYDIARQTLRPMIETDQELMAQRKAMEEVRYFDVEHEHGAFRGSCRGLLMIDYLDVAFRPSAGFHGFRMPFKLLKLKVKGRSVELINISDNKRFQNFKFHDDQAAEKFRRSWEELKTMARQ